MKTIVIAGAHSDSGKSTLARAVQAILPGAVTIKIGTGTPRENCAVPLYPPGTAFATIAAEHAAAPYLIIESNSILNELVPDLLFFLPGDKKEKPSAGAARERADLIGGTRIACRDAKGLARRLEISPAEFCRLLDAADIRVCSCEFGVF